MRVEIEASRRESEPRAVALEADADTPAGQVLDVLGSVLGLREAAGAVQARSLASGRWLDRSLPLAHAGLLRGERLRISVGLRPGSAAGPLADGARSARSDDTGRIPVDRPARPVRSEPSTSVALPVKRRHRPPRRFPLGAMLIPLGIGLLLVVVTRRPEIALFSLFTPVMVAWNYVEERRARADEIRDHGRTYAEEVEATLATVRAATADWRAWRLHHHPAPAEVEQLAGAHGGRLWERRPGDPDFLRLRLGLAGLSAPVTLRDDHSGPVRDPDRPDYEGAARAEGVPVVVDLAAGALAVVAAPDDLDRVGGWLLAQLSVLHSPAEVALVACLADRSTLDWVRWLPHVPHDRVPVAAVVDGPVAADRLLEAMERVVRETPPAQQHPPQSADRGALVVVVDDRCAPDPRRVAALCGAHDRGIHVVWLGTDAARVPGVTAHRLAVHAGGGSAELLTHRGGARVGLDCEGLGRGAALEIAAALAPLRDAADRRQARSVADRVRLEDLVPDLASPTAMRRRWAQAPLDRLVARLGVGADGPVDLDLGPSGSHVLVGGTTGSGKSELLQAMVASLAAEYPPDRVSFLLVDYKGGAAFKDASGLPHCVGVVTDLDPSLTRRVLVALDAEIRRREHLLAASGARDVTELRETDPDRAPADLVIVVDEFATLAKELPAFVEGVVDVAARGRSLGLRLVLATQRPAGVVNDRIRANVGVRIALRVNDEEDSLDVIDVRDAAHISRSRPGRGYLRLHRDVVELQTAFVGGPAGRAAAAAVTASPIWVDDTASHPAPGVRGAAAAEASSGRTSLQAVVEAATRVAALGGTRAPHVPWLPALPPVVTVADLEPRARLRDGAVVLGLADLPEQQQQRVVALDLDEQRSMLVFGTSRSGKTTVLRTLAASLIATCPPERLELHVLDFAGHDLLDLAAAPQVASVVGGDEPGRLVRTLRRLGTLVEQRRRGGSDHASRVVVLLDSWSGATATLERLDGGRTLERLERIVVDGPPVGVHVVITADRRAAVPAAVTSTITTRLVLRMADRDDYALFGLEPAAVRDVVLPPGRGFVGPGTQVQVAVHAATDPAVERDAVRAICRRSAERWTRVRPAIGAMPDRIAATDLPAPIRRWRLPFALGEHEVAPVALDLALDHAVVAGPPRSGRSTSLAALATAARIQPDPPAVVVIAPRRTPLLGVEADLLLGPADLEHPDAVAGLTSHVRELLDAGRDVLCLVDDADALTDADSATLEQLAALGRDRPVRVVAAADTRWALRAYSGLVPALRRARQGVLLAAEVEMDGDLLGVRLRGSAEPFRGPGRGHHVADGSSELVQVGHVDPAVADSRASPATSPATSPAPATDNQPARSPADPIPG